MPKMRVLSHPNNANFGQSVSLNLGITETKSDLIAFLDSDDMWHPNKLKEQVKIFQRYSDVGLVYTNGNVIDETDKILHKILPDDFQEENIRGKILLKCYIKTPSTVMVRREELKKIGLFKPYLRNGQDHEMWIRMSEVTKFYYIPNTLAAYRRHPCQISSRRRLWENGFLILKEACRRYPYGINLKRRRMAVLYYRLGQYDWRHNNDYLRSSINYFLAATLDPCRAMKSLLSERKT